MWIAFLTGLFGSFHCLSMCGALVMALPSRSLKHHFLYQTGRILTYAFLGGLFGFFGKGLFIAGFQQFLSVFIGVLIILLLILPKTNLRLLNQFQVFLKKAFMPFLKEKNMLMIGILNGFLPCGLVYLAIMGAVAMADIGKGALYMLIFGFGTLPVMATVAYSRNLFSMDLRSKMAKLIPVFTFFVGFLFIIRGLNLGIPYLSPKMQPQQEIEVCHGK